LAKECRAAIRTEHGRVKTKKMDRLTDSTYFMGVLHGDGDDDTVEVRILRPHEAYRKSRTACSQDIADDSPTDVVEAFR
jgi:hypothetical protein